MYKTREEAKQAQRQWCITPEQRVRYNLKRKLSYWANVEESRAKKREAARRERLKNPAIDRQRHQERRRRLKEDPARYRRFREIERVAGKLKIPRPLARALLDRRVKFEAVEDWHYAKALRDEATVFTS